ncbi:unnamed protein product, partial [Allacma fusca]
VSGVESIEKKRSSSRSSSSESDSDSSESTPPKKSRKSKSSRKRAATKRKSTSKNKASPKKKKVTSTKKKPATKRKPATTKPAVKRKLPVARDETPEIPPEGVKTRSQTRSESKSVEEGEVTQSSQETLELAADASEFEEQPESRPPLPNVPAPEQPPPPSPERVLQDQQPGLAQLTPGERAQRAFQEREREFRRNMEIALRHHDREAARVREGRMDLGPIEDYFEPLENCPPPPAPVWLMAEFRYEPRGERYVRGMFFPVTRDTIQQSMQSRGILINNELTVRDDLYYQRDGGAWILGRVYRGGATYYVINSFVVIGDALAHAVKPTKLGPAGAAASGNVGGAVLHGVADVRNCNRENPRTLARDASAGYATHFDGASADVAALPGNTRPNTGFSTARTDESRVRW